MKKKQQLDTKSTSIGYITGHNFSEWCIPQKIQTRIVHSLAESYNKTISYNIVEYLDSKNNSLLISRINEDRKIKNIFFVSALQLGKNKNNFFHKLNKYNLFFFLENLQIKKDEKLNNLVNYINQISERKSKKFKKNIYTDLFFDFQKNFKK